MKTNPINILLVFMLLIFLLGCTGFHFAANDSVQGVYRDSGPRNAPTVVFEENTLRLNNANEFEIVRWSDAYIGSPRTVKGKWALIADTLQLTTHQQSPRFYHSEETIPRLIGVNVRVLSSYAKEPLIGAVVYVNDSLGASTNIEGAAHFQIDSVVTVSARYIAHDSMRVLLKNQASNNILIYLEDKIALPFTFAARWLVRADTLEPFPTNELRIRKRFYRID